MYRHLDLSERYCIAAQLKNGIKAAQIAGDLGRDPTSIRREIARAGGRHSYDARSAHSLYMSNRAAPRGAYRFTDVRKDLALFLLEQTDLEPMGIGPRLRLLFGPDMGVSGSTIYRYIYADAAAGGQLWRHLRTARVRPKPRPKVKKVRQIIEDRKRISQRPAEVDQLGRIGDLERDTIVGPSNRGAILTIVDRKSDYCWLAQTHDRQAQGVHEATLALLRKDREKLHTITNDNGGEFAKHKRTGKTLKLGIYFADPYATNQRARIERLNKLIRQYIPKGRDVRFVQPKELRWIADKLNNRPREKLGYLTPNEVFLAKAVDMPDTDST
jgi:IS30 family transposase